MGTNVEWTKDILLIWAIVRKIRSGGLPAEERRALAEQFGVSEEVVLRYERARTAYNEQIADKRWRQAKLETILRMTEGGETFEPERYADELEATLERMSDAEPANELTRELRDATDAIRAEIGLPPVPPDDRS
ncbi:hypothetical protein BE17_43995 [Sorangium cellulosum]|uniref:Uncharacterized protein n=1 Tax=Sorangium cellulosum TaxID=56 RepID=A0A150SJ93_SORCE|nr:hypothetical protein BE17_43995 [Sorangium cellulosum]